MFFDIKEHFKKVKAKHIVKEICQECNKEFTTYDGIRHQIYCKKCRDKFLKRKLRLEYPEKYTKKVKCILTRQMARKRLTTSF